MRKVADRLLINGSVADEVQITVGPYDAFGAYVFHARETAMLYLQNVPAWEEQCLEVSLATLFPPPDTTRVPIAHLMTLDAEYLTDANSKQASDYKYQEYYQEWKAELIRAAHDERGDFRLESGL